MRRQSCLFALLLCAFSPLSALVRAADRISAEKIPIHGIASDSFAPAWTSAFVTGNGTLGAMVMGASSATPPRPNEDSLFLSCANLFLPVGTRQVVPQLSDNLADMRSAIKTKGYGPALMSVYAAAQKQNFPGLTYTDPFLPALELKLKMPAAGTARNYLRTENFQTGEVSIFWSDDAGSYVRKLFISRDSNIAVLSIASADPAKNIPISCDLSIPPIPNVPVRTFLQNNPNASPTDAAANALINATVDLDSAGITLHAAFREGKGTGYDAALRVIPTGGTMAVAEGAVSVKNAQSLLVLLRVQPYRQTTSNSDRDLRQSLDEIPADYAALLEAHRKIHQPLFDRVSIDLHGGPDRALTTDALITRANKENNLSPALLEKLYDASRYSLICSSGLTPPNLQGVWAGQWAPSFTLAGDYAFDSSFQLSIAAALSCNTPELMQGTFHLADDSVADWQLNAKNLFGARGIVIPAHQSSSGLNLQWSDRSSGPLLWTAGGAILAHWYYDYFLYTGDRQFLATQAVPFMKQVAAFYEDFLFVDSTGKYRFSPSYSADDAAGDNSTQDIMVARELLTNLIAACKLLNVEPAGITKWQSMLDLMPPYQIADDGELQEWALPGVSNKFGHRHIPHLYAIYQSHEFDPEKTPAFWKASQAAFETRLNQWFKPPTHPGDMNPQPIQDRLVMGLCAARFGQADAVNDILTRLAARNVYPSLMTQRYEDAHTLVSDGNAIPEIVNSALIYSVPGRLDLLPALPPSVPSGEIRGLAARSLIAPITITRLSWTPREIQIELTTAADQSIEIRAPGIAPRALPLKANQKVALSFQHKLEKPN